MSTDQLFLSCDWGTSSFRLRLVEGPSLDILAEVVNKNGIASSYEAWKKAALPEDEQIIFYQNILQKNIEQLEQRTGLSLKGMPVIVSGMASSSLGMKELPYKELPFFTDGSDLEMDTIQSSNHFMHDLLIVSGVRSDDDVMRGEEIQLVGSINDKFVGDQLFIMPGTHSKHVKVSNNVVVDFQTYMTGEMFNLLSTKSILAASVEKGSSSLLNDNNKESFVEGVNDSTLLNPLHAIFLVRTNALFEKMTKEENYYYLSGLVIGLELNELSQKDYKLTLIADKGLQPYYEVALEVLGFTSRINTSDVNQAILRGHYKLYNEHLVNKNLYTTIIR